MHRTTFIAALLAAAIGAGTIAAPVPAEAGSISISVTPRGKEAKAIRKGLELYSLFRSERNRARIDQKGSGNAAAIGQGGSGNNGLIVQRGKDHTATLDQSGNRNAFGIFQFGKGTSAHVAQDGDGEAGFLLQGGW